MVTIKELLKLKEEMKRKRPHFTRQDNNKKKTLDKGKWRKPKGYHSKMRLHKKGYKRSVKVGYKSPLMVRGMTKDGLIPMLVYSINDFALLDNKKHAVIIGKTVGMKKKPALVAYALNHSFVIRNMKNPEEYEKRVKEEMLQRNSSKKNREEIKTSEKDKTEKKTTSEKEKEKVNISKNEQTNQEKQAADEKEKKLEDKKEKDKLLIRKQ